MDFLRGLYDSFAVIHGFCGGLTAVFFAVFHGFREGRSYSVFCGCPRVSRRCFFVVLRLLATDFMRRGSTLCRYLFHSICCPSERWMLNVWCPLLQYDDNHQQSSWPRFFPRFIPFSTENSSYTGSYLVVSPQKLGWVFTEVGKSFGMEGEGGACCGFAKNGV